MTNFIAPLQLKHTDYEYQYDIRLNFQHPSIKISKVSNDIVKQIGNNLVLKGLDVKIIKHENDILFLKLCSGNLIQDLTFIQIFDDIEFNLDISSISSHHNLAIGNIIIYTEYKHSEIPENNKLIIKLDYLPSNGNIINWNDNIDKILLLILSYCQIDNQLKISSKNKLIINGKKFYYKGYNNYTLSDIISNWSTYLDYFGECDILDYKNRGNLLHEYELDILNNDYVQLDVCKFYNYQTLFIDIFEYNLNNSSMFFNYPKKNFDIDIIKSSNNIILNNTSYNNKKLIVNIYDNNGFSQNISIHGNDIQILDIGKNTSELTIDVFISENNKLIKDNSRIFFYKYNNFVEIHNLSNEKIDCILTYNIVDFYNTIDILPNEFYEFKFDINPSISYNGIYTDMFYLNNNKYQKVDDKFDIIKFNNYIRIYNNSSQQQTVNLLFKELSTNYINLSVCHNKQFLETELEINKIGNGNGQINSNYYNFSLQNNIKRVLKNKLIEIEAIPDNNSKFIEWNGCDQVIGTKCYIKPLTKRLLTVNFMIVYNITVQIIGDGEVYSSPIGIDKYNLSYDFYKDDTITLIGVHKLNGTIIWNDIHINNIFTISNINENKFITVRFQ